MLETVLSTLHALSHLTFIIILPGMCCFYLYFIDEESVIDRNETLGSCSKDW